MLQGPLTLQDASCIRTLTPPLNFHSALLMHVWTWPGSSYTASQPASRVTGMGLTYPAFRVAPWCSMRSSLSLGSKMLSSQGTPFSNSVARVGFSPMVPPLNNRTPSTALPSSLAGPPIKPMSPTCACTHRRCQVGILFITDVSSPRFRFIQS